MEDWNFPTYPLPATYQFKMMAAFAGMNVLKFMRYLGVRLGPDFIDYIPFPIWRPAVWRTPKVGKGFAFVGIPQPEIPDAPHPFDYARSTRYNSCVMIRETPDPDVLSSEDYLKHNMHGIRVSSGQPFHLFDTELLVTLEADIESDAVRFCFTGFSQNDGIEFYRCGLEQESVSLLLHPGVQSAVLVG